MKKKLKYLIPLILILIIAVSITFAAPSQLALEWNGASSGSSGGGTASNGYAVDTDGSALVGFRFSLVNSANAPLGQSVDVFTSAKMDTTSELASARKLTNKKPKSYWVNNYASITSVATTTATTNCYYQDRLGFATKLPTISGTADINSLSSNLNAWQQNTANINTILNKIGYQYVSSATDLTDQKIIIEPILLCRLAGNERHLLTMTEMAVYGGGYVYEDWNSAAPGSSNSGSWGYIAKYTNMYFPNYMTTPSAICNWGAAPTLSSKATFKNIITKGYGANVLSASTMGGYTNRIGHWAFGFNNNETLDKSYGNAAGNALRLGYSSFTALADAKYTLDEDSAVEAPNGFELRNTFGTSAITGSWANYSLGTTVTQKSNSMSFQYNYDPISYDITYDLAGGTNSVNNPSTYNVLYGVTLENPTKEGYTFDGWYYKTDEQTIEIASSTHNYNYVRVASIKPGTTYNVTMDSAELTDGTATKFVTLLWDFTDQKALASSTNDFGEDISYTLTCPESAIEGHDLKMLIYAGVNGSTAGNAVSYTNLQLEYAVTGINEGCDANFSSANDMYTQLSSRTTGDISLTAKWNPDVEFSFNANGGTGAMSPITVPYNSTYTLPANQFARPGYSFMGWHVINNSTNKWYVQDVGWVTQNEIDSKGYSKNIFKDECSGTLNSSWLVTEDSSYTFYAQWTNAGAYIDNYQGEDGIIGKDSNSGTTPTATVASFKQAYTNLKNTGGVIYIVDTVEVNKEITLTDTYYEDADGKVNIADGCSVIIKRYSKPTTVNDGFDIESNINTLIQVNSGGKLTLENVVIDGHKNAVTEGSTNVVAEGVAASGSILVVSEGGKVVVNGAVLQNNNFTTEEKYAYGGGINNAGELIINSGSVQNNVVYADSSDYGGGIYNTGTLTLNGGSISGNVADTYGGGVYSKTSFSIGPNVVISNNTADGHGGGVYMTEGTCLTLNGGTISGNSAYLGAGVFLQFSDMVMSSGSVKENIADFNAGGIYLNGTDPENGKGLLTIKGGEIVNNKAVKKGAGVYCYCGSILMNGGKISNNGPKAEDNSNSGAGVYMEATSVLTMNGGEISHNNAVYGGGIYLAAYGTFPKAYIKGNAVVAYNTATREGGGIENYGGEVYVSENGTIKNNDGYYGGGILNFSILEMSGGSIIDNTAAAGAGIYNCDIDYFTAYTTLSGGTITGNKATYDGNGVYQDAILYMNSDGQVALNNDIYLPTDRYITVNGELTSLSNVGIITPEEYELGRTCVRTAYTVESAEAKASAVYSQFELTPNASYVLRPGDYLSDTVEVLDTDVVISEKYTVTYDANGGTGSPAAQIKYWNEDITLSSDKPALAGSLFKEWNTAADGSGTSYAPGSTFTGNSDITLYAQWTDTSAYIDGYKGDDGVIGSDSNSGLTPSDPVATFKQAYTNLKNTGGTIFVVDTVEISKEITLTSNYYEDSDGKISIADGCEIIIKRYSKPTTVNSGFDVESNINTLIQTSDSGVVTLKNIVIDGHKNVVAKGSVNQIAIGVESEVALITAETGVLNVQEGAVLQNNNNPNNSGGGITVLANGTLNMTGGSIQNNNAKKGAGINNEGTLNLTKGVISSNVAYWRSGYMVSGNGGGIYSTTSFSLPEGVVIKNNFAVTGGGVYVYTDDDTPTEKVSIFTLEGAEITGNSAGDGGGVYVSYSNLIMKSGKVSGNNVGDSDYDGESYGYGGGISVSGDSRTDRGIVTVLGGEISRNTAVSSYGAYGAGIHSHWAIVNISGGVITNNSCSGDGYSTGGGVFLNERSVLNMSGGTISKNTAEEGGGVGLVYYYDSTANFSGNALVTENTATYGGGVYNYGCGDEGGGIYVDGNAKINKNTAEWGGGIYCDYGHATITGGTVASNTASHGGGAYLYNESVLTLTSNSIYSNSAEKGGGVYVCGADEYNDISTFKMYDAACVGDTDRDGVSDSDEVYLEDGCYISVPSEFSNVSTNNSITTSKKALRAIVVPSTTDLGRVVAKFGDESSTEGKKALYWNPDNAKMTEQYFVVDGKILRSGDQGASDIESLGVTSRDVFISQAYDIFYNANGGTGAPNAQSKYWNESIKLSSTEPTYANKQFKEWNTAADGSGTGYAPGTTYAGNASITLYAQWETINYTVQYDGNGHTGGATESSEHVYGEEKALTANGYTKRGYIFDGWNTAADGSGTKYKDKQVVKNLSSTNGDIIILYAQWKEPSLYGTAEATINVGDVFDPMDYIEKFNIPEDNAPVVIDVIYNGVPRDDENRATTAGTGYTVVYNIEHADGTTGQYRLIVTVVDGDSEPIGYIRFISLEYLDTLEENSKWRSEPLKTRLETTLNISEPSEETAQESWHLDPEDIQAIKDWVEESEDAGKGREEQNAEFGSKFGDCQTKGDYADKRAAEGGTDSAELLEAPVAYYQKENFGLEEI